MKKNRTFSSLKPIRSLLPENIKKLIKNKSYTDYDTLKTSWKTVLGEDTAKKCELVKMEKYNRKKCIFLKVHRQHLIKIDYDRSKPNGTPRKVLDVSLAKKYGWTAKTSIKEAVFKTYDEYKYSQK